ncbi:MAG TPA: FUSC family protein, partial [Bryobacteraceae bacterium]|nr:FUSC family protein [Bryobacteraceae bacterium]
ILQTALSLALWPLRRHEPENRVVGDLYLALADMAAVSVKATEAPPVTAEISQARKMLSGFGRGRSNQAERYWSLISQAERIRISLLVILRLRARLEREAGAEAHVAALDKARELAADVIRQAGRELTAGGSASVDPDAMHRFTVLADDYRQREIANEPASVRALVSDARYQLDALAGQLRAAMDLAAYSTPTGRAVFEQRQSQNPWRFRVAGSLAILRANLNLRSAAFRHAIRLAMCVGVATAMARSFEWERSYWLPMTVAIILKPDFTGTFSRGVLRLAGTAFGLLLATLLFQSFTLTHAAEVVVLAGTAFVLRCFGPANYGIFVTAISALVVLLFALTGVAPADVVASRATSTVVGGVLALGVYTVWPTWERTQVSETLANLLDAYRDYFRAVREGYTHPDDAQRHDLDVRRLQARVARTNTEAAVERLRAEPGVEPERLQLLDAMLASSHRFAHAVLALEAGLTRSNPAPARPQFVAFANQVELTLYLLARWLRGSQVDLGGLPNLRAAHHQLIQAGDPLTERYALVNVEADRMTNSVNTFAAQLAQWPSPVAFSPPSASSQ